MTGAEHAREAERLLATIEDSFPLLTAQIHATLAVAAEQCRVADLLDAASDGDGVRVYATVEGTSSARAVRVDARQP